ncbi:MAG: hypothetical protein IJN15_01050 [Clostridia bacterium]|nr:hypothetical protein [Clostridia bacterium]
MKGVKFANACNIISIVLLICFVVNTIIDYMRYSSALNSAPFRVWILVNAVYFILPAIIVFIVGAVIRIKNKR